eukprot:Mrub_08960.p1 GENE.Mrub_08960~~Mrub_08960.p1  ORF type:complete len:209 (+),score=49.50 Mrub_08960:3-629(+)
MSSTEAYIANKVRTTLRGDECHSQFEKWYDNAKRYIENVAKEMHNVTQDNIVLRKKNSDLEDKNNELKNVKNQLQDYNKELSARIKTEHADYVELTNQLNEVKEVYQKQQEELDREKKDFENRIEALRRKEQEKIESNIQYKYKLGLEIEKLTLIAEKKMKEVSRLDKLRQDLEKRWNDECDRENDRVEDMDEKMKYIDDLFNEKFEN